MGWLYLEDAADWVWDCKWMMLGEVVVEAAEKTKLLGGDLIARVQSQCESNNPMEQLRLK